MACGGSSIPLVIIVGRIACSTRQCLRQRTRQELEVVFSDRCVQLKLKVTPLRNGIILISTIDTRDDSVAMLLRKGSL